MPSPLTMKDCACDPPVGSVNTSAVGATTAPLAPPLPPMFSVTPIASEFVPFWSNPLEVMKIDPVYVPAARLRGLMETAKFVGNAESVPLFGVTDNHATSGLVVSSAVALKDPLPVI